MKRSEHNDQLRALAVRVRRDADRCEKQGDLVRATFFREAAAQYERRANSPRRAVAP